MKPLRCPLTSEQGFHPCPVQSCPANLAAQNPSDSCAHELGELSHATLAAALKVPLKDLRRTAAEQTAAFGNFVSQAKIACTPAEKQPCRGCGYPTPCVSDTLCRERQIAAEPVLSKIHLHGAPDFTEEQLWRALAAGLDLGLDRPTLTPLRSLVRATGEQHEQY